MPRKAKDLTGQKFKMFTVISRAENRGVQKRVAWNCVCDCGNKRVVYSGNLKSGLQKSCGCAHFGAHSTHGMSGTAEYNSWQNMKKRCYDFNNHNFKFYAVRGITVCDRWRNSFENFISDMGLKPTSKHTIDRIDNDGNYAPDNCRWATQRTQHNNKRSNVCITHNGKTQTMAEWARDLGTKRTVIWTRINRLGWDEIKAITTPVKRFSRGNSSHSQPRP